MVRRHRHARPPRLATGRRAAPARRSAWCRSPPPRRSWRSAVNFSLSCGPPAAGRPWVYGARRCLNTTPSASSRRSRSTSRRLAVGGHGRLGVPQGVVRDRVDQVQGGVVPGRVRLVPQVVVTPVQQVEAVVDAADQLPVQQAAVDGDGKHRLGDGRGQGDGQAGAVDAGDRRPLLEDEHPPPVELRLRPPVVGGDQPSDLVLLDGVQELGQHARRAAGVLRAAERRAAARRACTPWPSSPGPAGRTPASPARRGRAAASWCRPGGRTRGGRTRSSLRTRCRWARPGPGTPCRYALPVVEGHGVGLILLLLLLLRLHGLTS